MKRIISVLLAVLMLFSCMSVTAFAAEEPTFDELQELFLQVSFSGSIDGGHYEPGTAAPAGMIFWYLQLSGKVNEYYDFESGNYVLPYATYMAIVNKSFTNPPEMRKYLIERGYLNEETNVVEWFGGGMGGNQWELLNVVKDGSKYTLTGLVMDVEPMENVEGLIENVNYRVVVDPYFDSVYPVMIYGADTVTVVQTEDGFLVDGYTRADYYIVEEELYYTDEETGEQVAYATDHTLYDMNEEGKLAEIYSRVRLTEAEGAVFVTTGGEPLTSVFARFDKNDDYWYVKDKGFNFAVKADEGVEVAGVGVSAPSWGDLLGAEGTIEPNSGSVELTIAVIPKAIDGDLNGDNSVTNADLVLMARYIVGLYNSSSVEQQGDMNHDGDVTNADLVMIARVIVGL